MSYSCFNVTLGYPRHIYLGCLSLFNVRTILGLLQKNLPYSTAYCVTFFCLRPLLETLCRQFEGKEHFYDIIQPRQAE
jgi:hypothetical protein